jgi:hypothetical protein
MRLPRFGSERPRGKIIGRRFLAAIEGTVIGLTLGLIDIHSTVDDWFDAGFAYAVAGLLLGLRHGRRSWQAWCPLGWCFYLMHRVAIARGYRPPYVEEDADKAIRSLFVLWPAGLGLALGAFARLTISGLSRTWRATARGTDHDPSGAGNPDVGRRPDPGRATSREPAAASTERMPRRRLTVAGSMVAVAWIGIYLATLRALLVSDPFLGFGTIYSEGYSEGRFNTLRVGMGPGEVESIVGRPLGKVPWNQHMGPHDEEMWYYSDRLDETANYHRRWVVFENGKVVVVINDFWVD